MANAHGECLVEPAPTNEAVMVPELGLRDYVHILLARRWWFVIILIGIVGLTAIYTFTATPIYEAQAKLLVEAGQRGGARGAGGVLGELMSMTRARTLETQIEIIKSATVMRPARTAVGLQPEGRRPRIRVSGLRDADVVTIACQSEDRALAAKLANAVADEYVLMTLERNQLAAKQGREFVAAQSASAREELRAAEDALKQFREASGITAVGEAAMSLVARAQNQADEANKAQAAVSAGKAEGAALRKKLAGDQPFLVASQTFVRNPLVDNLRGELASLESERAHLAAEFAPTSQKVKALDGQIKQIRTQMSREAERVVSSEARVNPVDNELRNQLIAAEVRLLGDIERRDAVQRGLRETREQLQRLPADQRKAAELQRAVTVTERTYLMLVEKLQELRLSEESAIPSATVIEQAVLPLEPIKPNKKRYLLLGAFFGVLLAFAGALLVNYLDDTFGTVQEIEQEMGLPVLAVVYRTPPDVKPLLKSPLGRSAFAEAFRLLRSGLRFSAVKRPISTLVVTSVTMGEGKSTISANTAIAWAESGQRTILVDADLRRPTQHKVLDLENSVGLTSYLINDVRLQDAIQQTPYTNLSFLSSGPLPPNPGELFESTAMRQLVAELRQMADIVILDAPPGMILADTQVLASICDATLFVVDIATTKRPALRRMADVFGREGNFVPGVVVNKARRAPGSYYYHYSYDYSQYYTDEEDGVKKKRRKRKHADDAEDPAPVDAETSPDE